MKQPNTSNEPRDDRPVATLAEAVDTLNRAIQQAVEAGVSVELVRAKRHHDGQGNWGDQYIPACSVPQKLNAPAQ